MRQKYRSLVSILLILIIGLVGVFFWLKTKQSTDQAIDDSQLAAPAPPNSSDSSVLGMESRSEPVIYVSGQDEWQGSGGVVALSTQEDPLIKIHSNNFTGSSRIDIFPGKDTHLLEYLVHDEKGFQTKKEPSLTDLSKIASVDVDLISGYQDKAVTVNLPIEGSGIWILQINYSDKKEYAFVIRSGMGVLTKEGDNELIFWAQSFQSRRSLPGVNLKVYHLLNTVTVLDDRILDNDGITTTPIRADCDVALATKDGDIALVPLNLKYLNSSYNDYQPYQSKGRRTKYYVFTDRPLYRPGDTVFFKAILRDDDDARYTIPQGSALIKIYPGWDEKNAVLEQNIPISVNGSIDGTYRLSDEATLGSYTIKVTTPGESSSRSWYDYYYSYSSNSFNVQYFRKPEYSIQVAVPNMDVVVQDKLSYTINANYFFGQPVTNEQIQYRIFSSDYWEPYSWGSYQRGISDDYRYSFYYGDKEVNAGAADLNHEGQAVIDLDSIIADNQGKTKVLSFEATLDDGSGNPAFDRKNILVYAGTYSIYLRDDQYIPHKVNEPLTLPVVAVSHRGDKIANQTLTANIRREDWIYFQEPDKKYLSSRQEEEKLSALQAVTNTKGEADFVYTPTKHGSFTFSVEGKDERGNIIRRDFSYWVSDQNYPYFGGEYQNQIAISTDKKEYRPGDTMTFHLESAFPDRDFFLSLERARVNRYQILHMHGNTTSVDITAEKTDMPNIFAKVSGFSDDNLDNGTLNIPISIDSQRLVIDIKPDRSTYGPGETVSLNLVTTDIAGNPVSGESTVWVVDKALFELAESKRNKIIETFWEQRSDGTQESHSLEGIFIYGAEGGGGCFTADTMILMASGDSKQIAEVNSGEEVLTLTESGRMVMARVLAIHQAEEPGYLIINDTLKVTPNHLLRVNQTWKEAGSIQPGDYLTASNNKPVYVRTIEWLMGKTAVYNLQIETYHTFIAQGFWVHNDKGDVREVFKDTAYWNPAVITGQDGRAQVKFNLPDNLTTWAIAAVGATTNTVVGEKTAEIVVSKDLVVRPILPNILRIGDESILSATVHNYTDIDQSFTIDLGFDSGRVENATYSSQLIKAGSFDQFNWKVLPLEEQERGKLVFSARSKSSTKSTDTVISEIPVLPFGYWDRQAQTGQGSKTLNLKLAKDADMQKSQVKLTMDTSLLGFIPQAADYLIAYPYGCVEQTTSRLVPAVVAKANPQLIPAQDKDLDKIIKEGVKRLVNLQHYDGGWSWWWSGYSDPFITSYVVEFIVKARDLGIAINTDSLNRAKTYLERDTFFQKDNENEGPPSREQEIGRSYGLSFFDSDKGKKTVSDWEGITPDVLALAIMLNVRNGLADPDANGLNRLISLAQKEGEMMFWQDGLSQLFPSKDTSTALAVRAMIAASADPAIIAQAVKYLVRGRENIYWSNSFATAQTVQALADFSHTANEEQPNYRYQINLDGKVLAEGTVSQPRQALPEVEIPSGSIKDQGAVLDINKTGQGQLYWSLISHQYRTDRKFASTNHGLTIKREYLVDGDPVDKVAVGQKVTVRITLGGLEGEYNYGIIEDRLPAGLIAINPYFKNEEYGKSWQDYYRNYDISDKDFNLEGVVLSLYRAGNGERTYTYDARAVSEGKYAIPPAYASLMYAPEVYGLSDSQSITIKPQSYVPVKEIIEKYTKPISQKKEKVALVILIFIALVLGIGIYVAEKRKSKYKASVKPVDQAVGDPHSDSPPSLNQPIA